MNPEGELRIELQCQGGQVKQVHIQSSRPLHLSRLFKGKPVDELLNMIPLLYSVCGTAQAAAAAKACRQAICLESDPRIALLERMLVNVETAREHLWRVLSDWSATTGRTLERTLAISLSTLVADAKQACFPDGDVFTLKPVPAYDPVAIQSVIERISEISGDKVYAVHPTLWYGLGGVQDFNDWLDEAKTDTAVLLKGLRDRALAGLGDGETEPLPEIDHYDICQRLAQTDAEAFIAAPDWCGKVYETGPLTRQASHPLLRQLMEKYGQGLMTRLVARLLELASMPGRLAAQLNALARPRPVTETCDDGALGQQGVAQVEAARGRLIHRAVQRDGIITCYQILAPTEWNFHPQGVVARGLKRLSAESDAVLKQQVELLIKAVDPCVGYRLEVADA